MSLTFSETPSMCWSTVVKFIGAAAVVEDAGGVTGLCGEFIER
jgi:hypothetical protein